MFKVQFFVNTPVSSNCYLIYDKEYSKDCVVIDPGTKDNGNVIEFLIKEGLVPIFIILTHEHFDHCWGVNQLVEKYHIPIICSALCAESIKHEKRNCSVFYDNKEAFTIKSKSISVESIGNELQFGNIMIQFYNTPGHSDASISFVADKYLFTGDTLIKDEKTVTKLPTGSLQKLKESIKTYSKLKDNGFIVCAGHGDSFPLDLYDITSAYKRK